MIYALENEELKVQINSIGAELWSIRDKRDETEHLWQGDPAVWGRRAPNLFPFCGRLVNNEYKLGDNTYHATMHGFSRDYDHEVAEQNKTSITFRFTQNEETLAKYPFHFCLNTRYELIGDSLTCAFEVVNTDECELPFSIGYHTGYMCPFDAAHSIEDYSLVFEKKESVMEVLCDDGFITGEERPYLENQDVIPMHDKLFPDSFILKDLKSKHVSIVENATGRALTVDISGFPYVVFWSTPGHVPFVCIEPWYGLPDMADTDGQFLGKPGIQKISAGKHFTCAQTIEVKGKTK